MEFVRKFEEMFGEEEKRGDKGVKGMKRKNDKYLKNYKFKIYNFYPNASIFPSTDRISEE